jgi:hypothetical protein
MSRHSDGWERPRSGGLSAVGAVAVLCALTCFANAADTGAVGNGDWSTAATWSNGVPGAMDNAYIGGGYPTGAATAATVTLSRNSSANNVDVGFNSGTTGTLDLNGFTLTANILALGSYSNAGSIARTGGGTLSIGSTLYQYSNNSFSFAPGDVAYNLSMANGATVTTAATSNLKGSVIVGPGCTLALGANLNLPYYPQTMDLSGTLNANGYAISNPTIYFGYHDGPFALTNRGPISATNFYVSSQYSPSLTDFVPAPADAITNLYTFGVNTTFPTTLVMRGLDLVLNRTTANPPTYSTATITAAGNVGGVTVNPGCTLTLATDANVSVNVTGTLNANGHTITGGVSLGSATQPFTFLNRGPIIASSTTVTVTSAVNQSQIGFDLTTADSVGTFALKGVVTALPPGVSVQNLNLFQSSASGSFPTYYATATTSSATSVTNSATVFPGCTLTLGANLSLPASGSLDISGTVNAQGHAIAAGVIDVGDRGGPAALQNDGLVTAKNSWNQRGGSQVRLNRAGDVLGVLLISNKSALTIGDAAGQMTGTTVSGLSIDATSDLTLEVNGLAGGWVFRWANPSGGNHVADLQTLINGGEITFSSLNGGSYALTADSAYTYVSVTGVPEPGTLALTTLAGLGLGWAVRRRRGWRVGHSGDTMTVTATPSP